MVRPAGESLDSSTSGVSPIRSSSELPTTASTALKGFARSAWPGGGGGRLRRPEAAAGQGRQGTTGHRREENHGRALAHRRVQAVARAHVLAVHVDVDERTDLTLAVDARAERRDARRQVLEELPHRGPRRPDLARAARLRAEDRRDSHDAHLAQNST